MKLLFLFIFFACMSSPALAQEPAYDDAATQSCLQEAILPSERRACIGASSTQCLRDGGGPMAETFCYDGELGFWDDRLNAVYAARAQAEGPEVVTAMRQMQLAWIAFRDARCDALFAAWGEGTGRSPALIACLMRTTAEQTLFIEDVL